jgi:hypothetical protein
MSIHFRCARCQSSFPVGSQLRDKPNQCPICKSTALSAELGPQASKVTQRRTTVSAPARTTAKSVAAEKPANPDRPAATTPVHRGINWRIVGAAGAGALLVVGAAVLAITVHGLRQDLPRATAQEKPPAVAQEEIVPVTPPEHPVAVAELPTLPPPPPPPEATEEVKPAPEAPAEKSAPAEKTPLVFKHRTKRTEEALRRELVLIPEMNVKDIPQSSRTALAEAPKNRKISPGEMPDFRGLPMRMGIDCQIGEEDAKQLQALSRKLRTAVFNSTPRDGVDTRPDVDQLRGHLRGKEWQQAEAVATLTQMLMPEGRQVRMLLVELLANIPSPRATAAIAQRALFDLSQDVREAAVLALRDRPAEDYRSILLQGFRYPWAPAADHAADAIVTLEDRASIPELLDILRQPDPTAAFRNEDGEPVIREMVRINHLANCTMCHAASPNAHELVRGRVPSPGEPLPPPVEYYSKGGGIFVRADVTYLQQDFSVPQPVTKPGPWPTHQRYDYMIRLRPLKTLNLGEQVARIGRAKEERFGQREATLFALRELTGKDAGRSPESWERVVREMKRP